MAGQEGRVNVEDATRWDVEELLPEDLTVGHDHDELGLEGGQRRQRLGVPQRRRLANGQAQLLGGELDGGWFGMATPPRGPVWLRVDSADPMAVGSKAAQGGHCERGAPHEDDAHGRRDSSTTLYSNASEGQALLRLLYGPDIVSRALGWVCRR